ncbi:MAG TPA: head GIN domain-containing protein [Pseudomonadales bacterium]
MVSEAEVLPRRATTGWAATGWVATGRGFRTFLGASLAVTVLSSTAQEPDHRELEVGEFHSVRFTGPGVIRLTQGPVARLSARGTEQALANVEVTTHDGTLHIRIDDSAAAPSGPVPTLVLQVASLTELIGDGTGRIVGQGLEVESLRLVGNGSGSFELQGLEANELIVEGRGATRFELTGQVGRQSVHLSGTGAYDAAGLISNSTRVNVAGASSVRLWADERLDVEVAGAADIRYAGSPRVAQRITGVASVQRIAQIVI